MLDTYFIRTNIAEQTTFDVGAWINNKNENVGQIKVFLLQILELSTGS